MRVELVQPAVDHVLDKLLPFVVVQFADVVRIHFRQDLDDLADELIVLVRRRALQPIDQAEADEAGDHQEPDQIPKRHRGPRRECVRR